MVPPDLGSSQPYLSDFGIAKDGGDAGRLTETSCVLDMAVLLPG